MSRRVVIALGGNALGKNLHEQMEAVQRTSKKIVALIERGYQVVLTHGNGPQVGLMIDCFDTYRIDHDIDDFTMSVCVSITQGYIGYDLQNVMRETMLDHGLNIPVSTVITQVVVDPGDPAFVEPTKPIGVFLNEEQAAYRRSKGEHIVWIDERGYRQVVASPMPQHIVESETIKALLEAGQLVIACGGGGIPVFRQGNHLKGAQAVIDKDFTSAKLCKLIGADEFVILTAVQQAALNYGKPDQTPIEEMTCGKAQSYIDAGHFGRGSMLPKVQACMQVVRENPGCKTLITSLDRLLEGLDGKTGTRVLP